MWRMVRNPESDRSSGIIVEAVAGNRLGITDKVPDPFNLVAIPTVIPAQAGIQWFNNPFPRSGNDNRCDNRLRASGKIGHPFTTAPPPSWIPAFAGMTAEAIILSR